MGHQFSTPTGLAGGARALILQYQAEFEDAGKIGAAIASALGDVANTCDDLQSAKAQAAAILTDPRLTSATKTSDARAVVVKALDAAKTAGAAYTSALDTAQAALSKTFMPKMPSGADASLVGFRAGEIVKLLENGKAPSDVILAASRLLADALATGDGVKAYIVAGGVVLTETYSRLGVDAGDLQAAFGREIAKSTGNAGGTVPGAQLLALLTQGGAGTLRGFSAWIGSTLYTEQGNFDRSLSAFVAIGGVQGQYLGPGSQPAFVPSTNPAGAVARARMSRMMSGYGE